MNSIIKGIYISEFKMREYVVSPTEVHARKMRYTVYVIYVLQ